MQKIRKCVNWCVNGVIHGFMKSIGYESYGYDFKRDRYLYAHKHQLELWEIEARLDELEDENTVHKSS